MNRSGAVSDPRSPEEREEDRRAVYRQVSALGESTRDDASRQQAAGRVRERRGGRSDLVQFEFVRDNAGNDTPVVQGEFLVRADLRDDDDVWQRLRTLFELSESDEPEYIDCLDNRLVRWSNATINGDQLDEIARSVRASGHQASVNHVPPLGLIIKGGTGPEPSALAEWQFTAPDAAASQVKVAVIDTGITDQARPDGWLTGIARVADNAAETTSGNVDVLDTLPGNGDGFLDFAAGHGTFVMGIIAQVAPGAEIVAYRAVDTDGVGTEVDVACAMVRAVREGARILNLSLGGPTLDDQPLLAVEVALELIDEMEGGQDVIVVTAAGNDASSRPCWPAASRRMVAVAALTSDMTPAGWSNRGHWVDCSTVGEGLLSTYVKGKEAPELDPTPDSWESEDAWAVWSGTSFAAPQIAGEIARRCLADPALTPRQALVDLLASGKPVPDFGRAVRLLPGT